MEEIAKIISAISEVTGLDRVNIIQGKTDEAKRARDILCFIAIKDMYGLTWKLMELLKYRKSQVYFSADRCKDNMEEDVSYILLMNAVRKELGLVPLMTEMIKKNEEMQKEKEYELAKARSKKIAKRIFGIEYSKEDDLRMIAAIKSANEYMKNYCKTGRQSNPLLCN